MDQLDIWRTELLSSITSASVPTARILMTRQELLVLGFSHGTTPALIIAYEYRVQNREFIMDKGDWFVVTIRNCALKVGNFLDSDNLVASYIMYVHDRHAFGTLDLHQRYKQVSWCGPYIHTCSLLKARFPLAALSLEIRWKSQKKSGSSFFQRFFFVLEPFICSSCIAILKFRQGTLDLASVRRVVSIQGK